MRSKKKRDKLPTVIDIFCGAGGFSEGFRQQGFKIVMGIDHWAPAIETFNHNFRLKCPVKDVLDFSISIDEIEALPDTDIILGSPPCVTFSSSNISGKADKTEGVTMTQIFLRIVAVKKWKKNSQLKAWYMENVPSSIKHLASEYTFDDLGLGAWATKNKLGKSKVAIKLEGNQQIINSADYGSPQSRERVISGEVIKRKKLLMPIATHSSQKTKETVSWVPLKEIKNKLPLVNSRRSSRLINDPNYPSLFIKCNELTDHFYDTGLYKCEWRQSRFLKENHPYMGYMYFPEDENRASRTITATIIKSSREAHIYRSEYKRKGNGQYRTPTIREAACIMGFPVTYQFLGTSKGMKWRLIGNAVCPSVSRAFAALTRKEMGLKEKRKLVVSRVCSIKPVMNLNTYRQKTFGQPPERVVDSRFRRHPFKDGNITVTLSNYDISTNGSNVNRWRTSIQYGNGDGFPTFNIKDGLYKNLRATIKKLKSGKQFLKIVDNGFTETIAKRSHLQLMYEEQRSSNNLLEPTELVEKINSIIEKTNVGQATFKQRRKIFKNKEVVPVKQLFALYAINKVATIANSE
jgi:DNA (cytosine-5)-methyltransferase 1